MIFEPVRGHVHDIENPESCLYYNATDVCLFIEMYIGKISIVTSYMKPEIFKIIE